MSNAATSLPVIPAERAGFRVCPPYDATCCSSPNIAFTTVLPVGFVRGSWLRLRKTSKLVAQFNQGGCCQQTTAAIAWCRRIKRHSLRRPGAGHGGTTCEGANPGFPVNNRKFTGIFSLDRKSVV